MAETRPSATAGIAWVRPPRTAPVGGRPCAARMRPILRGAAPDRLRAVGDRDIDGKSDLVGDILEELAQLQRARLVAHFGGRPDGQIEHEPGNAGGKLLR